MNRLTLLTAVTILSIGFSTGFSTACQKATSQQANVQKPSPTPPPKQETEDDMKRISVDEAKAASDKGDAVIVDTRAAEQFEQEHIKGAVNIPSFEFQNRYKELPTDKQIIAYCS